MRENRRTFLRSIAAAAEAGILSAAHAQDTKFESAVIGGMDSTLPALRQKTGARIASLETFTSGNLGFVRLRTDDGGEGWGQLSPYDADISATILHRKLAPLALGKDPAELDAINDRCIEANYKFPWSFVCRALAGLDTAAWDWLGKRSRKPVCELLGAKPNAFPVYGSSMSRTITPEKEAERLARLRDERGFTAFKIRIGKQNGRDQDEFPGRTEKLVPAVRKAVGPGVKLLADGNSCYTPPKAIQAGRLLEEHDFAHFEEPCPYWELEWTAQVAQALRIPIAGGEQDNDLAQWRRMIRMKAVDIVQPDICYVGGLTRALRVADMARRAGLRCVPHSANLSMVTLFSLHMMAAIPNAGDHVEFTIESDPWTDNLFQPALRVAGGKASVPDAPGWGVTLNPEWIAKAQQQASRL